MKQDVIIQNLITALKMIGEESTLQVCTDALTGKGNDKILILPIEGSVSIEPTETLSVRQLIDRHEKMTQAVIGPLIKKAKLAFVSANAVLIGQHGGGRGKLSLVFKVGKSQRTAFCAPSGAGKYNLQGALFTDVIDERAGKQTKPKDEAVSVDWLLNFKGACILIVPNDIQKT